MLPAFDPSLSMILSAKVYHNPRHSGSVLIEVSSHPKNTVFYLSTDNSEEPKHSAGAMLRAQAGYAGVGRVWLPRGKPRDRKPAASTSAVDPSRHQSNPLWTPARLPHW
jgi:hypothetical protein